MPFKEMEELKRRLVKPKHKSFIRPSTSSWEASAIFVKKSDGSLRMYIDYRRLNRVIVNNRYQLPTIDDVFHQLSGAGIFSQLDLVTGFIN